MVLLTIMVVLVSASDQPENKSAEKKITVAAYPFTATNIDKAVGIMLYKMLVTELGQSRKISIIAQDTNMEVEKMLAYANSDKCDATQCHVEIGKAVPANKIMVGEIGKLGSKYIISGRVIDIEKNVVDFSFKQEKVCSEEDLDQLISQIALEIRSKFGEHVEESYQPAAPSAPSANPAPVTAASGKLTVSTTPSGADVYLDAEKKGKTPLTLEAPAGSHLLTVTAQGYAPLTEEVNIQAYQTSTLSRNLAPQIGSLSVKTNPDKANIYLDGKFIGQSPIKVPSVLAGEHKVKAELKDYTPAEQTAEITHQQTTEVSLDLSGLPGKILVTSVPDGADVSIDGESKGKTTYSGTLVPGNHTVAVSKNGFESSSQEVVIRPNQASSSNFNLKTSSAPQPASVGMPQASGGNVKLGAMVQVPAGEFMMGCNEQVDKDCDANEKPYHKVYLDAYYIDKYDVTQGEYNQCVSAGRCKANNKYDGFTGDRQPVVGVTWDYAKTYCEWAGKRLPTEAEWEKAARGTDGRVYPWGNSIDTTHANYASNVGKTTDVGSYPSGASPYGVMDMAGNVWNWVADWSESGIGWLTGGNYYRNSPSKNPKGPDNGTSRVLRGGGWGTSTNNLRGSVRDGHNPAGRSNAVGFRCARD
jgi:formylglycine-generating enzyme required for sulfatase activity